MDCSLPSSSVHGILQARTLGWVAVPFSRGSFQPRDPTQVSHIGQILYQLSYQGSIIIIPHIEFGASLVAQLIKNLPAMWETWV